MLREADPHLPKTGWGRIVLSASASASRAGRAWTDEGTARQERGLKHRADNKTRTIPIPPVLVRLLRAHIKRFGTPLDGRVFQTARGGVLQDSGYNEVWDQARREALTPAQYRSPLGAARNAGRGGSPLLRPCAEYYALSARPNATKRTPGVLGREDDLLCGL